MSNLYGYETKVWGYVQLVEFQQLCSYGTDHKGVPAKNWKLRVS